MVRGTLFMSIKKFLLLSYIAAGLIISVFTAFMTFYIIDVEIGMKMLSKIIITITTTLPVIAILSYLIGNYFSKKFTHITQRLDLIANEDFSTKNADDYILEAQDIKNRLNSVSKKLEFSFNELKEKNSELSWMVRSFAHDFRTPLTIIKGNLEAIEDGLIPNEKLPYTINKLQLETNYMNELLSDVLQFIQSMKSTINKENIELQNFINREIFALFELNSSVELINDTTSYNSLLFTKTDLKKILINLLDNSIKYTQNGTIKFYYENDSLIIEDTGKGVEVDECEAIFKPFFTVDESKNRQKSGFGLGLSIAKNLAEKNSFTLQCDPLYRQGLKIILKENIT